MSDAGQVEIRHDEDGGITVVLARPAEGNALSAGMTEALRDLCARPPEGARFIVLQGEGEDFCAGRDSPMPPPNARISAAQIRTRVADPVLSFYETVRSLPIPLIAAVRGRAHGVGFALAGLADIVVADRTADFQVPEMNRDIPPLLVAYALADRLPRAALARALYGRERFDAEGAVALGIATEATEDLAARLAFWRGQLAQNSVTTLSTVKRFLNAVPEMGVAARRDHAAAAISAAVSERFMGHEGGSQ